MKSERQGSLIEFRDLSGRFQSPGHLLKNDASRRATMVGSHEAKELRFVKFVI